MTASLIGARIQRKEDYRFLTGAGMYTDDVALPGQTYAAFVRSPHAHARIRKIAVDRAEKETELAKYVVERKDRGKAPKALTLNVKDVQKLKIVVGTGDLQDIGKHVDLADAKVTK